LPEVNKIIASAEVKAFSCSDKLWGSFCHFQLLANNHLTSKK